MFAASHLYGRPDDLRRFVNAAHACGMGIFLDVVYNHFGPAGNYLRAFSPDYFTDRYENEWDDAINFDGPESGPVREFFVANAAYWIQEFHFDGLRLDATQQMFDASEPHIITAIGDAVRRHARSRRVVLIGENESQETVNVKPATEGGRGLDALWNDDFHHSAMVALTGRSEAYYSDTRGDPQEFVSAAKDGYLFQGQVPSPATEAQGNAGFRPESDNVRGVPAEPRPSRQLGARPAWPPAHEPREMACLDRIDVALSRDADAVSRARVRGLLSVPVLRRLRERACRCGSPRTSRVSDSVPQPSGLRLAWRLG